MRVQTGAKFQSLGRAEKEHGEREFRTSHNRSQAQIVSELTARAVPKAIILCKHCVYLAEERANRYESASAH